VGRILSVQVGKPQPLAERRGRTMYSAIVKAPVSGRVRVEGINIEGDQQADLSVHGGPDKAVYAYAREDSDWWEEILGVEIPPGMFGENLTLEGIDVTNARIGEHWRAGSAVFEVCQPRLPCSKLGLHFGNLKMVRAFGQASRPGAYLRIIEAGDLAANDEVAVLSRPEHGVTVALVSDAILKDRSLAPRALAAPELSRELYGELGAQAA
jgi:MOSC domain-containing protein YiiM